MLSLLAVQDLGALTYNWTGGAAGNWDVAANWDVGATYPGQTANDVANIAGGANVTITGGAGAITIDNLNLVGTVTNSSGNLLTVSVAADITGTLDGGGGGISVAAVTARDTSNILSSGPMTISGSVNGDGVGLDDNLVMNSGGGLMTFAAASFGPLINDLTLSSTNTATPDLPDITVTNDVTVNFTGDNLVVNSAGATITVPGRLSITAPTFIRMGYGAYAGTLNFGEFFFNAANITVEEDSAMAVVDGSSASTNLDLTANGAITQTAGGAGISVSGTTDLDVPGGADITLDNASNNFTGDVTFTSGGTIDDIRITDDDGAFNVQAGLSIGDDFVLSSAGNITFIGAFSTNNGPVDLTAGGTITATAGALDIRNNSLDMSAGAVSAIDVSNAANELNTVTIAQSGDAHIVDADTALVNGLILGDCNPGSQFLHLECGGSVTQIAATSISVGGLALEGAGPYELTEAGNQIDTLAFDVTNQVDVRDGDGDNLVIDTVDLLALARTGNDFVLQNDAGTVTQNNLIQTSGAGGLLLLGNGNFTLTNVNNNFATIAANTGGNISYTGAGAIDVGSVTSLVPTTVNGISSGGGNVTLTSLAGAITVNQVLNAGAGDLNLTSTGGAITQGAGDTITATGTAAISSNGGASVITLDQAVNNFGTLILDGTTVEIQEAGALTLGNVNAATFELDADGAVGQNGGTSIQTTDLVLLGNGSFTLTQNNNAGTIAADAAGDILFTDSGALDINTVLGVTVLRSTAGDIALNVGGALTQTNEILASGLLLDGAGPFTLTNGNNNVASLAADTVTGLIDYVDINGFDIDTVQGSPGITSTADVKLTAGAAVGQTAGADMVFPGLLLQGSGPYELMEGNNITTLAINTGGAVDFHDDTGGLTLGSVQGVNLVDTGGSNLVIESDAGTVNQTRQIAATGLLLRGAGDFNLVNGLNAITTLASDAGGNVSYTDSGALIIGSVSTQVPVTVNGIDSSAGNGNVTLSSTSLTVSQAVNTGTGDFDSTTTNGAIAVNAPLTTDVLDLTTANGAVTQAGGGPITAAGIATINSDAGGDIVDLDQAANDFGTLVVDGTDVEILEANALILGDVGAVNVTNFELNAGGAVTQSGITTIQTNGLSLLGTGPFTLTNNNDAVTIAGNTDAAITYTDTVGNLDVGTVLAATTGITTTGDDIILDVQAGALTVSQAVTTGLGIGNIDLAASTTIDLDAPVTAGTGDVILDSGNAVNQTVELTGAGLLLQGAGPFNLTDADNDVNILAADSVTGLIDFRDADGFSVGTVQAVNGVITTTAGDTVTLEAILGNITVDQVITTSGDNITVTMAGSLDVNAAVSTGGVALGDIDFNAGTGVTLDAAVSSGLGNVLIDSNGAVSQTAAASGTGILLTGNGPYDLSTQDNLFTGLAANVAVGTVAYNDGNNIDITTVGATNGITTVNVAIAVSTTAGSITVSQPVSTGSGTIGDITLAAGGGGGTISINNSLVSGNGDLTLDAGSTVSQAVVINDVTGLELLGAGPFNLSFAGGNQVDTLAANVTGNITYIDQDALSVGTVNLTAGATLAGNVLDIETVNGGLTIDNAVNSAGGNIILDVGTTAGGTLAFNAATTSGAGDITAATSGNISQIAAGAVSTTGTSTFTANAGAADIDLTASAANDFNSLVVTADRAEIRQSGAVLDLGAVDATIFSLDSDSEVTQSGDIDDGPGANELLLLGAGPFRLIRPLNDVDTIAADITGSMTYRDRDVYTVGTVLGQNGIAGAAGVVVSLRADALLDQVQPIVAPQLQLRGAGPFNLDGVATNDVDLIAADVTGQLDFEDADDVTIDTVTNTEANTINGINTNGNLLDFVAGGDIRLNMPVATGAGQILVFDVNPAGTIFFNETQPADTISTSNAAGINGADVLNDPIVLEQDSSLVSTNAAGDIHIRSTVNDDGTVNNLLVDSGRDILLDGDIGNTTPPQDLTLTTGPGSVTLTAANLDVILSRDFTITNGSFNMNNAGQSVSAGRDITGGGTVNMTASAAITAERDVNPAGLQIGSVDGAPFATINVGQNFAPTAFTHLDGDYDTNPNDSEVIFFDDTGNLVSSAGAYLDAGAGGFQNLTLDDPDVDVRGTGNWEIFGNLNLSQGNWDVAFGGARTHYVNRDWDSSGAFTYDPANSTIVFDGAALATLRTDGIGTESFNNLVFDKTSGSSVTLFNNVANTLEVTGNLTISDGEFIARAATGAGADLQITGNWTDTTNTAGDGFDPRNEEVLFIGGASNIDPEQGDYPAPYFWQLTVTDSTINLINDPMVVGDTLTVDAATVAAAMNSAADLTVNGVLTVDSVGAAASLTNNAALTANGALVIDAAAAAATLTSNGGFTSNGTVTLLGVNAPVLDLTDQDFQFNGGNNSLDNSLGDADPPNNTSGEIRYTGEQAVQDFPTVTAGQEFQYGLVTIYDGAGDGQVVESANFTPGDGAWFWNLTIDAPSRTIRMATDITVFGFSDPNGDFTLTNNPGPVDPTNLNGLRLLNGTLNAENIPGTIQYDIRLHGMMLTTNTNTVGGLSYRWGATPLANPLGATVEFRGPYPAYIEGNNTFFRFVVNTGADGLSPDGIDASVAGKSFYFEAGSDTTIDNFTEARFTVVGADTGAADTPFLNDPGWIRLLSGTDDPGTGVSRWELSKLANAIAIMRYVYVEDSDASAEPIVVQPFVQTSNCIGWVDFVYVTLSETRDQLNDFIGTANAANEMPTINNAVYEPDGRIDRLLVTVQAAVVKDFSGFEVEVDGYNVLGFDPGDDGGDFETLGATQFWIIIQEGDYLDTGATPAWRILDNTTVVDSSTGARVALYDSKDEEIPYDGSPPIIGYSLAVADSPLNQAFVHFSEPVRDVSDAELTAANFVGTVIAGGVASVTRVTPFPASTDNGMREVVLNLGASVTVPEITGNALNLITSNLEDVPSPKSPLADDAADPLDTSDTLIVTSHRISDIALGITGNGVVEPVVAIGRTQSSGGVGVGTATIFDGTDFLQSEDIELQVHRYTGESFVPDLFWEDGTLVPSSYKNDGLWLPVFNEVANSGGRPFSGLVPRPWSPGPLSVAMTNVSGDLYDNTNPAAPPPTVWSPDFAGGKITDGADLEFFFEVTVADNLYAGRCMDETAVDWYRRIRPWSILIREIDTQAGGISILNNIINPNRNEQTALHYELTRAGMVTIQVFDLAGGLVEVLQRGHQGVGEYSVSWNGRNRAGNVVARGIYFIRYVGPGGIDQIRKVLVVK